MPVAAAAAVLLFAGCVAPGDATGDAESTDPAVAAARREVAAQTSEVARVRSLVQNGEAQASALQDAEKDLREAKDALARAEAAARR